MANDQINVPSLVIIVLLSGLIIRYLFFSPPPANSAASRSRGAVGEAAARQREAAAERIQQMFPQVDRRTALWDLQRNGGNVAATTERALSGRLETPPITFQPPPPPGSAAARAAPAAKQPDRPTQPDLIQRYKLQDKVGSTAEAEASSSGVESQGKGKAWSANKDERQSLLQKRRDEMILAARRKMEAKIAAEKAGKS